jgi:hypothetical protein
MPSSKPFRPCLKHFPLQSTSAEISHPLERFKDIGQHIITFQTLYRSLCIYYLFSSRLHLFVQVKSYVFVRLDHFDSNTIELFRPISYTLHTILTTLYELFTL